MSSPRVLLSITSKRSLSQASASVRRAPRPADMAGSWVMDCTLHVSWDDRLAGYDFGPQHPLAPVRVQLTMELASQLGVFAGEHVTVAAAPPASDSELQLVHDQSYIEAVRYAGGLADGDRAGP